MELAGLSLTCEHSPLQRYFRLDQIIFSWEKQNTPSLPPLMLVSIITPVSATRFEPSKKRALVHTQSITTWSVLVLCLCLSTMSLSVGVCLVVPDVSNLWSVLEEPAVGDLVLPANIPGVLPQETDLLSGVSCVPEGVPQILPRTSLGLHNLVIKSLY